MNLKRISIALVMICFCGCAEANRDELDLCTIKLQGAESLLKIEEENSLTLETMYKEIKEKLDNELQNREKVLSFMTAKKGDIITFEHAHGEPSSLDCYDIYYAISLTRGEETVLLESHNLIWWVYGIENVKKTITEKIEETRKKYKEAKIVVKDLRWIYQEHFTF